MEKKEISQLGTSIGVGYAVAILLVNFVMPRVMVEYGLKSLFLALFLGLGALGIPTTFSGAAIMWGGIVLAQIGVWAIIPPNVEFPYIRAYLSAAIMDVGLLILIVQTIMGVRKIIRNKE